MSASQRRDPVQAIHPTQFLVNTPTRDHTAIADEHHAMHAESTPDLSYLGTQGFAVSRITYENLNRDWASLGIAQQTVNDLGKPSLAVAVVSELNQARLMASVVAACHVVEDKRSLRKVFARELVLDPHLSLQEPV